MSEHLKQAPPTNPVEKDIPPTVTHVRTLITEIDNLINNETDSYVLAQIISAKVTQWLTSGEIEKIRPSATEFVLLVNKESKYTSKKILQLNFVFKKSTKSIIYTYLDLKGWFKFQKKKYDLT